MQAGLQDWVRAFAAPEGQHDPGVEIAAVQLPGDERARTERTRRQRVEIAIPVFLVLLHLGQRGAGGSEGKFLVEDRELADDTGGGGAAQVVSVGRPGAGA